jgi:transposase
VAHRNARTTVYARRLVVQRHLAGWPAARIAEQLGVSRATVHKWIARYRAEGDAGLQDRPSRPHTSPTRTPAAVEDRVLQARADLRRGAVYLAGELGLVASTVGRILHRHRAPRLAAVDPITGAEVRRRHTGIRYERPCPGDLLHVDVKKLGRVPDGGGWRLHGRSENVRGRKVHGRPLGYDYLHVAIDDRTRIAYVEALPDERDLQRRVPAPGRGLVPWPGRHGAAGAHRQRPGLPPRPQLAGGVCRAGVAAAIHQARLPVDQRQS